MKAMKWIVTAIFLFSCFLHVRAEISNRVEGVVKDKDTRQPIEGAKVVLYECFESDQNIAMPFYQTKTAINGRFYINFSRHGNYFLGVFKDGYVSLWQLLDHLKLAEEGRLEKRSPVYILTNPKVFAMNGGQIKHFDIGLERGGSLEVTVSSKRNGKVLQWHGEDISVIFMYGEKPFLTYDKIEEEFKLTYINLPTEKKWSCFFETPYYKNLESEFSLEKGKVKKVHFELDFDSGQIIYGHVINKKNKFINSIELIDLATGGIYITTSNAIYDFCFGGLNPGKYRFIVEYNQSSEAKPTEFKRYIKDIDLVENEKKEIIAEI